MLRNISHPVVNVKRSVLFSSSSTLRLKSLTMVQVLNRPSAMAVTECWD